MSDGLIRVAKDGTMEFKMEKLQKEWDYSIVVPVYNEEESLELLFGEILAVMTPLKALYEIIFVNDASSDKSPQILSFFEEKLPEVVRVLDLPQRSGQTKAMQQGLKAVRGKIVFTLDADLQNDPADITQLISKINSGADCACGWRKARQDTLLKSALSKSGNVLQRLLTGLKIHDVSCTLRAYRRECVPMIPLKWEGQHRFIPLCLSLQGYKVEEIVSNHRLRKFGKTKYSHKRIFRVIVDFFRIIATKGR